MSAQTATDALALLDRANLQMQRMLPKVDGQAADQGPQGVQASAAAFVEAVAGMQQYLRSFAAAPPTSRQQQLEQEVQALEQELSRAEQLLLKTDYVVQQWQGKCQELRAQHEATLTDGISSQPAGAPASQD